MRLNPYDNVMLTPIVASSVAIQSLTGSSAVNQDSLDTAITFPAESIMIHVRAEIASGTPTTATVAWALQESVDGSTDWEAALDNTGTAIGATLTVKTVAVDSYARVEGINLAPTDIDTNPGGGRMRYLRIVYTPTFTGGSSPAILVSGEYIGTPASGQNLPVRTTVSNT
jgi:hypothetical protein